MRGVKQAQEPVLLSVGVEIDFGNDAGPAWLGH